jgi:prophage regulatory protein
MWLTLAYFGHSSPIQSEDRQTMTHPTTSAPAASKAKHHNLPHTERPNAQLPLDGLSRWSQIAPFSPFCRERFRQLVKIGKAPQPIRFSERLTCYSNKELHKFFADPLAYQVEVK